MSARTFHASIAGVLAVTVAVVVGVLATHAGGHSAGHELCMTYGAIKHCLSATQVRHLRAQVHQLNQAIHQFNATYGATR